MKTNRTKNKANESADKNSIKRYRFDDDNTYTDGLTLAEAENFKRLQNGGVITEQPAQVAPIPGHLKAQRDRILSETSKPSQAPSVTIRKHKTFHAKMTQCKSDKAATPAQAQEVHETMIRHGIGESAAKLLIETQAQHSPFHKPPYSYSGIVGDDYIMAEHPTTGKRENVAIVWQFQDKEFIVRACNNAQRLADALKFTLFKLDEMAQHFGNKWPLDLSPVRAETEAREALAQWEGGAK